MTVTEVRVFHLDGQQFRLMHDMVASRYDYQALRQDLRYIDKRIDDFASPSNFSRVVFEVLDSADRQGWLPELLQRFKESDFDEVRKMASEILVQHSSMPAASTASGSSDTPPSFPESKSHAGPGGVSGETNPYGTYLIGQRPFINRSRLRTCLKDLLSETSDSLVLYQAARAARGDKPGARRP
jgi:Effector-associated domain 1